MVRNTMNTGWSTAGNVLAAADDGMIVSCLGRHERLPNQANVLYYCFYVKILMR